MVNNTFKTTVTFEVDKVEVIPEDWLELKGNYHRVRSAFRVELAMLDSRFRKFVCKTFEELCPDYFWNMPAAMRGHHPRICQSLGGLVKHTRLACWWAEQLLVIKQPDMLLRNEVITALLLHDICKFKRPAGAKLDGSRNECHGLWAAEIILNYWADKDHGLPGKSFKIIVDAVGWHIGQWTHKSAMAGAVNSKNLTVELVQQADYIASRKVDDFLRELREVGEK